MPAHSGAITGTKAHQHSAPSADGGFLSDNITGRTGSANGSLVMYDGSSIAQDLAAGNLNDVLTMGAAVPAWVAPAVGASVWTKVYDSGQIGAAGDIDSGVFAAYDFLQIYFSGAINTAGWGCGLKFNNTAAASGLYNWTNTRTQAAATVYSSSTASAFVWDFVGAGGSTDWQQCTMTVTNYATDRKTGTWESVGSAGGAIPNRNFGAGMYENSLTPITRVEMCADDGTTGATRQFKAGSQMIVLGLT